MKRLRILVFALLIFLLFACNKKSEVNTTPNIVFYGNITAIEPLLENFETKSGITAGYTRVSATDFLTTIINEHQTRSLGIDVIQAPISVLNHLADIGILSPYISPTAIDYPDWAKREDEGIYKFAIEYVGIIYNSEILSEADAPTSYLDLLNPKFSGKIVMPDPSIHPTTISWLVALKEHIFQDNEEDWEQFIHGLAQNKPMFVESFTPTAAVMIGGERPIGISLPKYIITSSPSPLKMSNIDPMLGSLRGIGILSDAPNLENARTFIDYWLSDEVSRFLANEIGEYVLMPDVYPPIEGIEETLVIPIPELDDDTITYWGEIFKGIFY